MKKCIVLAILIVIIFSPAIILSWPVPDTWQTRCYDNTKEIPCPQPGQAFYGQDASYTINPMSYTKLDADGNDLPDDAASWVMVRDNVTGLIWESKQNKDDMPNYANPHDADNTYTWYDSNPETNEGYPGTPGEGTDTEDFINALNAANYGGHNDWRMPTIKELASLVSENIPRDATEYVGFDNIPHPDPTININYFPNTSRFFYWSSTPYAKYTGSAGIVFFRSGNTSAGPKYGGTYDEYGCPYVRAVRGGQSGSLDPLIINGDGTVTDISTGLMWQQDTPDDGMTWKQALSNCENSTLAGYSDWRLPTIKELQSIVDYSRWV